MTHPHEGGSYRRQKDKSLKLVSRPETAKPSSPPTPATIEPRPDAAAEAPGTATTPPDAGKKEKV